MIYQTAPPLKAHLLCYTHSPHATCSFQLALWLWESELPRALSTSPAAPSSPPFPAAQLTCLLLVGFLNCTKAMKSLCVLSSYPISPIWLFNVLFTTIFWIKKKNRKRDKVTLPVMWRCLCLCYRKSGLSFWWEGFFSGDLDFGRRVGVLGRDWLSCVCKQEGVGWQQFQVLLSGAWHNSSVEIPLQLSVWESDFYHVAKD